MYYIRTPKMAICTVTVDNRETRLFDILRSIFSDESSSIHLVSSPLEVGDITISAEGLSLIFERKTGADLAASVTDGRYREQKARLLSAVPSKHITYIIENKRSCSLSENVFNGVCVNTMYRDGIHMVYTNSIEQTAEWIAIVARKVAADPALQQLQQQQQQHHPHQPM